MKKARIEESSFIFLSNIGNKMFVNLSELKSDGSRGEPEYYGYFVDHPPSKSIELDDSKVFYTIENQDGREELSFSDINSIKSVKPHKKMLNEYDKCKNNKIKQFSKSVNDLIIWNFYF